MSDYERNKGVLAPFNMHEDFARDAVLLKGETLDTEVYDSYVEQLSDDPTWYFDQDIIKMGDKWYEVIWEVQGENDIPEYAEAIKQDDGTIEFHTYHYNGAAHWTEVVENALEGNSK